MIPRKLALRIWSACLFAQADHLEELARGIQHEPGRGEKRGRIPSDAKAPGRLDRADRLRRQGVLVRTWTSTESLTRGGALDPALVAIVSALPFGHGPAVHAVKNWLRNHGYGGIDLVDGSDVAALIRYVLETI